MKNNEKTSHDKIYITTEDHIPEQTLQNLQNTPKHNPDNIQNSLHEFINKNKLIRTSRHIHEHKI
jgi:hypothetical protein